VPPATPVVSGTAVPVAVVPNTLVESKPQP
jgi:hypothetical protein